VSAKHDSNTEKVRSLGRARKVHRRNGARRRRRRTRDAERARLELLADELRGVFNEVPADDEQFIFTVAAGTPPRLWIDMRVVVMAQHVPLQGHAPRRRSSSTAKLEDIADTITQYVAGNHRARAGDRATG
jgi:hypothetical protein